MHGNQRFRNIIKTLRFLVVIALLVGPAAASIQLSAGRITSTGKVKVNGQPANPESSIYSGAEMETGKGATALVTLLQLGSLQLKENSGARVDFNEARFAVSLFGNGGLRVTSQANVRATVRTADVQVAVDHTKANEFTIETTCGKVVVSAISGRLFLATGGDKFSVKEILAGSTESVATPIQPGCK